MFTETELPKAIIKKVSVVESFFNPLDNPIKKTFKELWMHHFEQPEPSFYRRLKSPIIEDYALIIYFLDVKNTEYSFLIEYYSKVFVEKDTKQPYPKLSELQKAIENEKATYIN